MEQKPTCLKGLSFRLVLNFPTVPFTANIRTFKIKTMSQKLKLFSRKIKLMTIKLGFIV